MHLRLAIGLLVETYLKTIKSIQHVLFVRLGCAVLRLLKLKNWLDYDANIIT